MDVRAVDTSSLAVKRAELEHGQPAKDKKAFTINRITPRTSQDAGGQVSRLKSSTEQEHDQGREREPEHHSAAGHAAPAGEVPVVGTEHILDVKV